MLLNYTVPMTDVLNAYVCLIGSAIGYLDHDTYDVGVNREQ